MKKSIIALLVGAFFTGNAQQFTGSTTTTGDINRTGTITINPASGSNQLTLKNTGLSLIASPNSSYPGNNVTLSTTSITFDPGAPVISPRATYAYNGITLFGGTNSGTILSSGFNGATNSFTLAASGDITTLGNFTIGSASVSKLFTLNGNATIGTTTAPKILTLNGSLVNTGTAIFGTTTIPTAVTVNGTLGIGTTNVATLAAYKLAVNGGIVATAMDINGTVPASDYVFEKDYKLRSLTETEAYITEHKHLPEVPSATEFKTNGYSVGKFDDIMLKKVEELTLYMIELQKQNEILKAKVESLEKVIR